MKKVLIVFSAVMLLSSFGVAFADGDAANLFKTHCQGSRNLKDTRTGPLAPNASWSWKTSSSSFRTSS